MHHLRTTLPPLRMVTRKGVVVHSTLLDEEAFATILDLAARPSASQFVQDLAERGFRGLSMEQMVWCHKLAMEARR
jgi:hypothetical protein